MEGELWGHSPTMALVLLASVPSGNAEIVQVRGRIEPLMSARFEPKIGFLSRPWVRHVVGEFHEFPSSLIYGFGYTDCQNRPSQWASPHSFLTSHSEEAYDLGNL